MLEVLDLLKIWCRGCDLFTLTVYMPAKEHRHTMGIGYGDYSST